jgi:hypothetical protein
MCTIDKIKSLLAMANDAGASEQERETAARQASKMMAKYEIDEYDLLLSSGRDYDLIEEDAVSIRPGKRTPASKVPPWINVIAFGVKTYTGTRCTLGGATLRFRGTRTAVELATWMHSALVHACYQASQGRPDSNAFRNGYASAIQRRLLKAMVEQVASEGGTQLVVVKTKIEEAMDGRWGSEREAVSVNVKRSSEGYSVGQSAHIPTNRPMRDSTVRGYLV